VETYLFLALLAAAAATRAIHWWLARQAECQRANRALRMSSRCREVLLHARSAEEMMAAMCRGITEEGSYSLAWTGLAMAGGGKDLLASAIHGTPAGRFAAAAGGLQRGGTCEGLALEVMGDGKLRLQHASATQYGYPSVLALPLAGAAEDAGPVGVLCVYSGESCAFDNEEVALLQALASDLALGLNNMREASKRRAAEQAFACDARHDPATGMANRSLFNDRLRQAQSSAERNGRKVAVLALTMDRYRAVKSSLGPEACSALLAHAASAMKSCLREGDTVAHLLGNEFAIILADMASDDDVLPVAAKLLEAMKAPMRWQDNIVNTTVSIGIALMGQDGGEASGMLRSANSAMAQAAGHGGNRFRFVSQEMNDRASRMFALGAELRRALVHNEMVVHYQPRAALSDGSLSAAEALVRWQHPTRGLVLPAEFLPLAESSGLIVPLGAWVIREVCRQQRGWCAAGLPMVPVTINLSPRQFREEGLVEHIEVALKEFGVPSAMLSFEITESMVTENLDAAVARMTELKAIGVQLSMGDFGTGHLALARLRRLPFDQLKIAPSIVRQIGNEQADEAICRSIIDVGHNLNMQIVGAGVETLLQRDWLRDHYCDEMQGCFFARPMAPEDFAQLLAADRPRSNTMLPLWRAINYKG
jgi:diguanylate cyclase (GGDEF)-like protein